MDFKKSNIAYYCLRIFFFHTVNIDSAEGDDKDSKKRQTRGLLMFI